MTLTQLRDKQEIIFNWRTEIITLSPSLATKLIRERLKIDDSIEIQVLGGFDSKVVCFCNTHTDESAIISISKPLIDTDFYHHFKDSIDKKYDFVCSVKPSISISPKLSIGLISLAKPEVYTFPRFALGISDIAHALRNQFKSDIFMFDLQLVDKNEILAYLKNQSIDLIGISMTFGLFDVMKELVSSIIIIMPDVKIIVGGSLAAIEYDEILNLFPTAIVSLGEGEKCMTQVVEWFLGEKDLSDIADIAFYNEKGEIQKTKHETTTQDMSLPEFDLLITTLHKKGVFQLETSRGCYNACSFCPRQHKGFWKPLVDSTESLDDFLTLYRECLKINQINVDEQIIYIVDEEFIGKECRENRMRTEQICALFKKHGVRFEISFRMDAIFSSKSTLEENIERNNHVKAILEYGLNRVLVGVESGVDSVLERFNKHISSFENTQGIRLLTALGVPVRFTYITFDPLMTLEELIATYLYQGRKDLIIDSQKAGKIAVLLDDAVSDDCWKDISMDIPFYYFIPYMLVSLECLIGSKYYAYLESLEMLEKLTIKSLGKKNARYLDYRIGILSHLAQLWIDRNFSLDYTLKSFGKIYPTAKANEIRSIRAKIKENSYRLLGKLIYLCTHDLSIIKNQPNLEICFMKNCNELLLKNGMVDNVNDEILGILDFQFEILKSEIEGVNSRFGNVLSEVDFITYQEHYFTWKNRHKWQLINYE